MTDNHPITPSPELVQQWYQDADHQLAPYYVFVAHCAAQWGANMELEACCEWLSEMELAGTGDLELLRADRRPKPPSLKEQALEALEDANLDAAHYNIILRALEALPND